MRQKARVRSNDTVLRLLEQICDIQGSVLFAQSFLFRFLGETNGFNGNSSSGSSISGKATAASSSLDGGIGFFGTREGAGGTEPDGPVLGELGGDGEFDGP
ncbi:MAG: hypothetical protein U0105_27560 [Candidatus Obscuribacterales bacterium]